MDTSTSVQQYAVKIDQHYNDTIGTLVYLLPDALE